MAVIAVASAKCSPGVSTTVAALTYAWPHRVLVADCDPASGDLAPGWLGHWLVDGQLDVGRGVLSYATDTRHAPVGEATQLGPHLQRVPVAPHAQLLVGLTGPAQHASVGAAGWRRLAQALGDASATGGWDVLIDAGRYGPATPPPLLAIADLVLVALRPVPRHVIAARPLLAVLTRLVEPGGLALAALASDTTGSRDLRRACGLPVALELPADHRSAVVFADGDHAGEPLTRSQLAMAARRGAERLHASLNLRPPPEPASPPAEPAVVPVVRMPEGEWSR